jgi:hypothetical protein
MEMNLNILGRVVPRERLRLTYVMTTLNPISEILRLLYIMYKVLLLNQKIKELFAANKKQKQKRAAPRSYITTGGVLAGAEGR